MTGNIKDMSSRVIVIDDNPDIFNDFCKILCKEKENDSPEFTLA
jgi:hypothetical protein